MGSSLVDNSSYKYMKCTNCEDVFPVHQEDVFTVNQDTHKNVTYPIRQETDDVHHIRHETDDVCQIRYEVDDVRHIKQATVPRIQRRNTVLRSASTPTFGHHITVDIHSGSVDSVPSGDIDKETMKCLSELMCQQPCHKCHQRTLVPLEGLPNVFECEACQMVCGFDDSTNYFDLLKFLECGKYRVEACPVCGNDDPYSFLVVNSDVEDQIALKCLLCKKIECEKKVDTLIKCNQCYNINEELFSVTSDDYNSIFLKCWQCDNEEVITPTICGCAEDSEYIFDEFGYISQIVCPRCQKSMKTNDNSKDATKVGDGSNSGRSRVNTLEILRKGDHIAWHQALGYWHHAIIIDAEPGSLNVVHYNGPNINKGIIMEEWISIDQTQLLYRIDYKDCNHPDVVIQRARSRVGEHKYNLLTNNCEHFARWCKTGQHRSIQQESFQEALGRRIKTYTAKRTVEGAWKVVKVGGRSALRLVRSFSTRGPAAAGQMAGQEMKLATTSMLQSVASKWIVPGIIISSEVIAVCRDISTAQDERKQGRISRHEFIQITIKRTSEGCGTLIGTAIPLVIPIPFVNTVVGSTLGSLVGQGAGAFVGRQLCGIYESKTSKLASLQ